MFKNDSINMHVDIFYFTHDATAEHSHTFTHK